MFKVTGLAFRATAAILAAPTFGGSVVAASTGAFAKGATTMAKATRQVDKPQKIVNLLKRLLDKLKVLRGKTKDFFKQAGTADKTSGQHAMVRTEIISRNRGDVNGNPLDAFDAVKTFPQRLGEKGPDSLKSRHTDHGKIARNANNGYKAGGYGDGQSVEQPSEAPAI